MHLSYLKLPLRFFLITHNFLQSYNRYLGDLIKSLQLWANPPESI
jgi:hypothetical protein